jgi:hypothetical protein
MPGVAVEVKQLLHIPDLTEQIAAPLTVEKAAARWGVLAVAEVQVTAAAQVVAKAVLF